MNRERGEITRLLGALNAGDREAFDQVWSLLYQELRDLARKQRHRPGSTLDTTALVHETYLKLAGREQLEIADKSHFFALAVRVMRQLLVDLAREHGAKKRGGGSVRLSLDQVAVAIEDQADVILGVDQALGHLDEFNGRWARVVECRFFGGLSEQETADVLGLTLRTVQRDWMKSRAWLRGHFDTG